jgi:serine/threonine protein kinase
MANFDGWEKIEPALGEGGQGKVYKARSPARAKHLQDSLVRIAEQLRNSGGGSAPREPLELAKLLVDVGGPDDVTDLGALKVFKIPPNPQERDKAFGRLDREINALKNANHPAVLKLLASNLGEGFIVTEFHEHGTLASDLNIIEHKGRALQALQAFRPLVEAVSLIHKGGAIHRDIKPENIFVANDGHLVLGDFGIVLFKDASGGRLTETYERAGSRDWMAPWANTQHRLALEDVDATLDIYPLGKVLWCMVSGRRNLDLWYYDRAAKGNRPANNLEQLFPGDPAMQAVNKILSKCVAEEEEECLKSADELLIMVDQAIAGLRSPGQRQDNQLPWLCRVCGKGHYSAEPTHAVAVNVARRSDQLYFDIYVCDVCRHVEFFQGQVKPKKDDGSDMTWQSPTNQPVR